jgi:DNA-directed RNA polymerase specialized sigma24 family protein
MQVEWPLGSGKFPTPTTLLAAIRRGDESAMKELFVIYVPVCREEARRLNVSPDYRDTIVHTVLDDVVLRLAETVLPPPALTTYVINALRNRVRREYRDAARARVSGEQSSATPDASQEGVVAESHSEYGIRISSGIDGTSARTARSVIKRLAEVITSELAPEDLALLVGVNRYIPLRKLAEEMNISHGAARARLSRLRRRLVNLAGQYVDSLELSERREVLRFLRRANVRVSPTNLEHRILRDETAQKGDSK